MHLTQAIFAVLTISQGLAWVDFIGHSITSIMPQNTTPPLRTLMIALTTTAVSIFVAGVIVIFKHTVHAWRKHETQSFKKTTGLYTIPTTVLHTTPSK